MQVINVNESYTYHTVRRHDCGILWSQQGRCSSCTVFRRVLKTCVYRKKGNESTSSTHSRTPNIHLSPDEKKENLRNLRRTVQITRYFNRLEDKIRNRIERDGIVLDQNSAEELYTEMSPNVASNLPEDSPPRILSANHK